MNGSDSEKNKVNLTIREHYIAHLLLRKIYPNSIGLSLAIELMIMYSKTNLGRNKLKINSRLFEIIKKKNLELRSKRQKMLRWICNKQINKQTHWPKNTPLFDSMVKNGWEFGRLKNKTYYMSPETKKSWLKHIKETKKKWSPEK